MAPATVEEMKELISENDFAVAEALKLLYAQQTKDEQLFESTEIHNNRGFNATDAPFCSSVAKQLASGKQLTYRQLEILRNILPKYSKQLLRLWKK